MKTLFMTLIVILSACSSGPANNPLQSPSPTKSSPRASLPSPISSPMTSHPFSPAIPTSTPEAGGNVSLGLECKTWTVGDKTMGGSLTQVRVGSSDTYDRIVFEYSHEVPLSTITMQPAPKFSEDASGRPLTLVGDKGVLIKMENTEGDSYSGPSDLMPDFLALKEARKVGDFERIIHWGLGIQTSGCIRAFILHSPERLVVDIGH